MFLTKYLLYAGLVATGSTLFTVQRTDVFAPKQEVSVDDSTGVTIKLVPGNAVAPAKGTRYKLTKNARLKIMVTNNSNRVIRALIVDTYYQNRPKLYKNGRVVPYRKETATLVQAKDSDPHFIRAGEIVSLPSKSTTSLGSLILSDWYKELEPGIYRLTNRYRLEMHGAWSADSDELEFEVVEQL